MKKLVILNTSMSFETFQTPEYINGWLKKRGKKGVIRGLKKRWFFQHGTGSQLYYSKDKASKDVFLGYIDLTKILSITKIGELQFNINTPSRIYQLETVPEGPPLDYWLTALTQWTRYFKTSGKTLVIEDIPEEVFSGTSLDSIDNPVTLESSSEPSVVPEIESKPPPLPSTKSPPLPTKLPPLQLSQIDKNPEQEPTVHSSRERENTELITLQELLRKKDEEISYLKHQMVVLQKTKDKPLVNPPPNRPEKQSYSKRDQLWHYIDEDNLNKIETLLKNTALDLSKTYSYPALHYAISNGSIKAIRLIAKYNPRSIDEPDSSGNTPLMHTIEKVQMGKAEIIVAELIKLNANVELGDVSENGLPPLHGACHSGNYRIVGLLLNAGADPHKCDTRLGWTSLHWAVAGGTSDIIKLLLDKGVQPKRINGISPVELSRDLHQEHLLPLFKSFTVK
jgi:hypothetical protein